MPCGMRLTGALQPTIGNRHHRPAAYEYLVSMCPRCALPQPAYERIWLGRWIAVVSEAQNVAMGGLHVTLPMRSDAQDRILDYLHEDQIVDTELTDVAALPIDPPLYLQLGTTRYCKNRV